MTQEEAKQAEVEQNREVDRNRITFGVIMILIIGAFVFWLKPGLFSGASSLASEKVVSVVSSSTTSFYISPEVWMWVIGGVVMFAMIFIVMNMGYGKKKEPAIAGKPCLFNNGGLVRWTIFFSFHAQLWMIGNFLLDYFIYTPMGEDGLFARFVNDLFSILGISLFLTSCRLSFDWSTLGEYDLGQISFFKRRMFKNVSSGIVCLGLPSWLPISLKRVNAKKQNITIGMFKGQRVPFIIQAPNSLPIFDVVIEAHVVDTEKNLGLDGEPLDTERRLVQFVNGALFDKIHELTADKKQRFPTYDDLPPAKEIISRELFSQSDLGDKFLTIGWSLDTLIIKDIENSDPRVVKAQQELIAGKAEEAREDLNSEKFGERVNALYHKMNKSGESGDIPADQRMTMDQCREYVERSEGLIQTIQTTGRGVLVDARGKK